MYEPSLCLIAQGSKRVSLGEHSFVYDASSHLLVSVDLPLVGHIQEASSDVPYLCCTIHVDQAALAELVWSTGSGRDASPPALSVCPGDPDLIDAACRLVALLDTPAAIPALAPLIEREVLYRLLFGPHGAALHHLARADSRLRQISRAIRAIRTRYHEQLRIGDIAAIAGMSPSSLHQHFKAITRLTPLGFQRQLRLHEARRLMLTQGTGAGAAGFAVGYDSPSQFSREYHRLFGAPPRRDVERLHAREAA